MKPHKGLYDKSAVHWFLHPNISIEQLLSIEAHGFSVKKFRVFLAPKYRYGSHINPPFFSALTRNNPAHNILSCFFKVHFNIVLEFALKFAKRIAQFYTRV